VELSDFDVGGAGLNLPLQHRHCSVHFSDVLLLVDHLVVGGIVLLVDLSKDGGVLLILHGVTLVLGTFQLTLQFLILVLAVALQLGLLLSQLHFLVNHGGDHRDLMLFHRAISNLTFQIALLVLDFVNLDLVLLDGVAEVFSLHSQLVAHFLHLGALLLLLD